MRRRRGAGSPARRFSIWIAYLSLHLSSLSGNTALMNRARRHVWYQESGHLRVRLVDSCLCISVYRLFDHRDITRPSGLHHGRAWLSAWRDELLSVSRSFDRLPNRFETSVFSEWMYLGASGEDIGGRLRVGLVGTSLQPLCVDLRSSKTRQLSRNNSCLVILQEVFEGRQDC